MLFLMVVAGGIVTLLGHGLWVLIANLFQAAWGASGDLGDAAEECISCGRLKPATRRRCGACGMDRDSLVGKELADLLATARQLERFRSSGTVKKDELDQLFAAVHARQQRLLGYEPAEAKQPDRPPLPVMPVALAATGEVLEARPVAPAAAEPSWQRLDQLLTLAEGELRFGERVEALRLYEQADKSVLAKMTGKAQLALARLLDGAGLARDAVAAYGRLLRSRPELAGFAAAAVEGARLAIRTEDRVAAEWLLERALGAYSLHGAELREAEEMLARLRVPVPEAEILDVVPVEMEAAVAPDAAAPAARWQPEPVYVPPVERSQPVPPPPPAVPEPPPRRRVAEILAAFMEDKNILWGELIGGLLIVGCSIALVISLWQTLEAIPYFPFLILSGITAALFGAGTYTLHHWKLESTSRGLLVIGTLLVPLDFMVLAGLVQDPQQPHLLDLIVPAASLAVFAFLLYRAGRVLVSEASGLLPVAVLGAAASQLFLPWVLARHDQHPPLAWVLLLGGIPVACQGLTTAGMLRRQRDEALTEPRVQTLFGFLGMATFAMAVALGFLVYWSDDLTRALQRLAVLVAVAGLAPLACGVRVHGKFTGVSELGAARTAGTAVALVGILAMLAAVALAWPQPRALVLVCSFNFVALTYYAWRHALPTAHAAALPCLALGYLTGFHWALGHLQIDGQSGWHALATLFTPQSGTALACLVAVWGAASAMAARSSRAKDGVCYALAAAAAAFLSLALVTVQRQVEASQALLVYGFYGVGALGLNLWYRRSAVSYLGIGLLVGATLWGLEWGWPRHIAWWGTALALEALVMVLVRVLLASGGRQSPGDDATAEDLPPARNLEYLLTPLHRAAEWTTVLALVLSACALSLGDSAGHWSFAHVLTASALAALMFVRGWHEAKPALTRLASLLVFAALFIGFSWATPERSLNRTLLLALLSHATVVSLGAIVAQSMRTLHPTEQSSPAALRLQTLLSRPLHQTALLASALAAPLLLTPERGHMVAFSIYVVWLAAFWLAVAWVERWPAVFSAFQVAVGVAVAYAVTAWLEPQPWVSSQYPDGLWDPRSLQAYGIGLALLSLVWIGVRIGVPRASNFAGLLETPWPAVDRILLCLLLVGQLGLAIYGVAPGVAAELTPVNGFTHFLLPTTAHEHAYGMGAWALLALLGVVCLAACWDRLPGTPVPGLVLLALGVALLAAGRWEGQVAVGSALRWGLALTFLACAVPVWLRTPLGRFADAVHMQLDPLASPARWARGLLVVGCAVPVLALTADVAVLGFQGLRPSGPAGGTFFQRTGWVASNVVPLLLLSGTLVGYALRERSAGHAFAAGAILNVGVMGGYALSVVTAGNVLGQPELVRVLQLGTTVAAAWALAWLGTRRWLLAWREDSVTPLKQTLMTVQVSLAVLGNVVLLSGALGGLTGSLAVPPAGLTGAFYPAAAPGVAEVGSWLGWTALALTVAAVVYRARQQVAVASLWSLGGMGLVCVAFVAVSVARWSPMAGYRTLMVGGALYAVGWALAAAAGQIRISKSEIRNNQTESETEKTESRFRGSMFGFAHQAVGVWVVVASLAAVGLGLKAALWHQDHLWAAGAIVLASVAGAIVAIGRRQEGWAFTAGLGLNLAAVLLVWHFHLGQSLDGWWFHALHAVCAASGVGALLWLAARQRFYGTLELRLSASPLLATQISLALLGNVFLLGLAGLYLFATPGGSPSTIASLGEAGGWLAFLLPAAAALWYAARASLPRQFAVVAICGLLFGVLAACTAAVWDTGDWLAFHALTVSWGTLGLLTLGLGLVALAWQRANEDAPLTTHHSPLTTLANAIPEIRRWVETIGLLVVLLALRGINDPQRPYWSVGAVLAVSLMSVGLALWSGRQRHVYQFGLLLDLAGMFVWVAHGPYTLEAFAAVHVLCLALASAFWTGLELGLQTESWLPRLRGAGLPFRHVAALLAVTVLGVLVALGVAADLGGAGVAVAGALMWAALAANALALVLLLWDAEVRWANAGLYALGLMAIALTFNAQGLDPRQYGWAATLVLVGYVGATSGLAWATPRLTPLWRALRLPERPEGMDAAWLAPAQLVVSCVVIVLSVWISLTFADLGQRLAGPLAAAALLPAGVLLTLRFAEPRASWFRHGTLLLGVLVIAELGWAFLGLDVPELRLHRNVMLMAGLALMSALYAAGLGHLSERWGAAARRVGPVLGGLASVVLLIVLAQEWLNYQPALRMVVMEPWAIAVVAVAFLGLVFACLRYALTPERDPLQLSERGRMFYVYAAELLLVFLFVHVRLTLPQLFGGTLAKYWTFIVMGIAFGGVGLSEFFSRRGLRVLAEPLQRSGLFLPLVPLLAFWTRPPEAVTRFANEQLPGMHPWLESLQRIPRYFDQYAYLWFLASLLYGIAAAARQSFRMALVAALAANFGLWALFQHQGWTFIGSPQLWLIPLALILLVAEHLNREHLTAAQGAGLRYIALGMIYLSATADMYHTGLSHSVLPALVLMVLAVGGMLVGMVVRVRAYLYLGAGFLFLTIFSMIWNAAVDRHQTWVWWASGIALGMAILAVFAVFEKRRNDVLGVLERIKQWD